MLLSLIIFIFIFVILKNVPHVLIQYFFWKTNEKGLKTLSFNDKDKIKGKVNSTRFDF